METFAVVFILGLIFIYSYITYIERSREIKWSGIAMDAQRECYRVSELINRVRANGLGFVERASLDSYPIKIFGNIGEIEVSFETLSTPDFSNSYFCSFQTSNVTNTTDFTFEIFGDYNVANEGQMVTFYKV